MWFFSETRPDGTTGNVAPPLGETAAAWFDGRSLRPFTYGSGVGYRAPVFDSEGAFWHATQWTVLRAWHDAMATNQVAAIAGRQLRLEDGKLYEADRTDLALTGALERKGT